MTCKDANKIPLSDLLRVLNCKALKQHTQKKETWYQNPVRKEQVSSFSVNKDKNTWYDFGSGKGGTVLDLIMEREHEDVKGALRWLRNNMNSQIIEVAENTPDYKIPYEKPVRYIFKSEQEIYNYALKAYLEKRGIDVGFAKPFVQEVRFLDTTNNKTFFSLGVKNLKGGYALRNSFGKTILGFNDLCYFKSENKTDTVCVFEGMFDFLSYLMITGKKELNQDILILNSQALAKRGFKFINELEHIKNILLFLDNPRWENIDSIVNSKRAMEEFENGDYRVLVANENYRMYSDLSEYWEKERSRETLRFSPIKSLLFSQRAKIPKNLIDKKMPLEG